MVASQELFLQTGAARDTGGISNLLSRLQSKCFSKSSVCVADCCRVPAKLCVGIHSIVWRSHVCIPGSSGAMHHGGYISRQTRGKTSTGSNKQHPNTFVCIYHQLAPCPHIIYTTVAVSTLCQHLIS